jgi:ketosteroid isomerase-like protein
MLVGMTTNTTPRFTADRAGWLRLFAAIDSRDAAAFIEFLTPDAQFRFGNAAALIGHRAIGDGVAQFFAAIGSSRHELLESWSGEDSAGCEGRVTYTRHDGRVMGFPFANLFTLRGAKISSYRIYIDNSALFAA